MPRSYEPEDALEVLQQRDRGEHPVMTAPEVAEAMGASRPTANDRLNTLVGRGDVERLDVGPTAAYYLAGEDFTVVPAGDDQKRDGSGGIRTDDSESSKSEEEDVNKESTQETNADAEPEVRTDGGQTSVERAVDWAGRGATVLLGIAVGGIVSPPIESWALASLHGGLLLAASGLILRESGVDRRVGEWLDARLRRIDEEGGALPFLLHVAQEESLGPVDPETPVERVARLDIAGGLILVGSSMFMLALGVWVRLGGAESVINILTPRGALAALLLPVVGIGVAVVLLYLSLLASFAIGGVRHPNTSPEALGEIE